MATAPDDSRFHARREQILKAAAACFNERGFSGTSLKDVSRRLGLTDAALYYYVSSKKELVYHCYLRAGELGSEAMDQAERLDGPGLDRIRHYLRFHIETLVGDRGPVAILSEIPALAPAHRERILAVSRRHSRRFEALLAAGIEDGSVRPLNLRMTGNAIMGAINWIPKWFHGDAAAARAVIAEFPAVLTRGLESPPDRSGGD